MRRPLRFVPSFQVALPSQTFIVSVTLPSSRRRLLIVFTAVVIDVTGTSSGAEGNVVVDLVCSSECANVTATGTDITPPDGTGTFVCQDVDTAQVNSCRCSWLENTC